MLLGTIKLNFPLKSIAYFFILSNLISLPPKSWALKSKGSLPSGVSGSSLHASQSSLSSQGFQILPHTIVKIDEAIKNNATILMSSYDLTDVHQCGGKCQEMQLCNLFVFSSKTLKCVLFDCKEPFICSFEDDHPMYVSGTRRSYQEQLSDSCFPKFRCVASGSCVPLAYTCDDYIDCEDESDELGCFTDFSKSDGGSSKYESAYNQNMYPKTVFRDGTDIDSLPREAIPREAELLTGNSRSKVPQPGSPHARKHVNRSSNVAKLKDEHRDRIPAKDAKVKLRTTTAVPVSEEISSFEKLDTGSSKNKNEGESEESQKHGSKFAKSEAKTVIEENSSGNRKQVSKSNHEQEQDDESESEQHPSFDWISSIVPDGNFQGLTITDIYKLTLKSCMSDPEPGFCSLSKEVGYFYNVTSQKCLPYHFSVCAIGLNRFNSKQECMSVCDSITHEIQQGLIEVPVEPKKTRKSRQKDYYDDDNVEDDDQAMDYSAQKRERFEGERTRTTSRKLNWRESYTRAPKYPPADVSYYDSPLYRGRPMNDLNYGGSTNVQNEEPVYWEQIHHGKGSHKIYGKTNIDDYDSGHLTIEAAAVIPDTDYDSNDDQLDGESQEAKKDFTHSAASAPQYQKSEQTGSDGGESQSRAEGKSSNIIPSRTLELGAAVPLVLGSSVLLLFIVLMSIRCYFWRKYPSSSVRFRRLMKEKNDYLIEGMYM